MAESGAVKTELVDYHEGGDVLQGFIAYPADDSVERPGVVVFHDWMGEGEYTRGRAKLLAEMGYVALSADMYGTAARPADQSEAPKFAGRFYADRPLMRSRARAALDALAKLPTVNAEKIAAAGYCFGGSVALELARSGADLAGVVVFHGGLTTPNPEDGRNIKGKVLALQGGDDPHVNQDQVSAFIKEMQAADIDWELVLYGGAVHAYTNPKAGDDKSKGMAYNPLADKRSWIAFRNFLAEVFG